MKQSLVICFLFYSAFAIAQTRVVKAGHAKKYIGKEIIICGKLFDFANSSYVQTG